VCSQNVGNLLNAIGELLAKSLGKINRCRSHAARRSEGIRHVCQLYQFLSDAVNIHQQPLTVARFSKGVAPLEGAAYLL
jgi:hypothetical protein